MGLTRFMEKATDFRPTFFAKEYDIPAGVIELSNIQMTLHIKNSVN